jgi:hypothetical protein
MYDYYRHPERINQDLMNKFIHYISTGDLELDEDYNGFYTAGDRSLFNPEAEVDSILRIPDIEFLEMVRLHYARHFFDWPIDNPRVILQQAAEVRTFIERQESIYGPEPMPGISLVIASRFSECQDEIELFHAYTAIRSIIGPKAAFKRTSKKAIVSRMLGIRSTKLIGQVLESNPALQPMYDRYMTRYRFDRLMDRLLGGKFITAKSRKKHALYLSCKLDQMRLDAHTDLIQYAKIQRRNLPLS